MDNKNCEKCGVLFTPKKNRQRFCCQSCSGSYIASLVKFRFKNCTICGVDFKTKSDKSIFCSKECKNKSEQIKRNKKQKLKRLESCRNCLWCDGVIGNYDGDFEFCLKGCYDKYQHFFNKQYTINSKCKSCNAEIVKERENSSDYCSRKCFEFYKRNNKSITINCFVCDLSFIKLGNKTTCSDKCKKQKHRLAQRKRSKRYYDNTRSIVPSKRIEDALRVRVYNALKGKTKKSTSTEELLGCTFEQARLHIELQFQDGMSWDNYPDWHIDHITPCASFDLTDPVQQRLCFNYKNLQPLWAKDNLSKGAKINN